MEGVNKRRSLGKMEAQRFSKDTCENRSGPSSNFVDSASPDSSSNLASLDGLKEYVHITYAELPIDEESYDIVEHSEVKKTMVAQLHKDLNEKHGSMSGFSKVKLPFAIMNFCMTKNLRNIQNLCKSKCNDFNMDSVLNVVLEDPETYVYKGCNHFLEDEKAAMSPLKSKSVNKEDVKQVAQNDIKNYIDKEMKTGDVVILYLNTQEIFFIEKTQNSYIIVDGSIGATNWLINGEFAKNKIKNLDISSTALLIVPKNKPGISLE